MSDVIDCHCHLSFLEEDQASQYISESPDHQWLMGGYQPSEWEHQVALKKKFPKNVMTAYGLHPWYVKSDEFNLDLDLEALKIWIDQSDWIGEVGLDFHGDENSLKKELQINVFEKQLELSGNKPFVFHFVQSHGKALEILNNYSVKGFVHGFSGSIEVAEQYYDCGILLSFGPGILSENYKKARAALQELPIESILLESDTPSHPVDDGHPVEILEKVYKEAASLRGIGIEELKVQVSENFKALLST